MLSRKIQEIPLSLLQLQRHIKKQPEVYKEDFLEQWSHYCSVQSVFQLNPSAYSLDMDRLVSFMSHVVICYPSYRLIYVKEILALLQNHFGVMNPDMKMTFCKALFLLARLNVIALVDLLPTLFDIMRSNDKVIRVYVKANIIEDVIKLNNEYNNPKVNVPLQNFLFKMLNDSNEKTLKIALHILMEIYKKKIWNDPKTVNAIGSMCFSKCIKAMVASLKFLTSSDEIVESNSESEDDGPNPNHVIKATKYNKKTKKRKHLMEKAKSLITKNQNKKKVESYSCSALHFIYDAQGFADKLFAQVQNSRERFEVKVLTLDVVSRLMGLHELIILNFYPFIQRFLLPNHKEVTRLLVFTAQASHELVPPECIEPVIRTIVDKFINERKHSSVMAMGLNTVRAICAKCPLALNEDLLADLVQYKHFKDKNVSMAAKSLIKLFREIHPKLLPNKYRGRPTEKNVGVKLKRYGEISFNSFISGAEALLEDENLVVDEESDLEVEDEETEDEELEVEELGDGEGEDQYEESEVEEEEEKNDNFVEFEDINEEDNTEGDINVKKRKISTILGPRKKRKCKEIIDNKKILATEVSLSRFFTDEDFEKIEAVEMKKQIFKLNKRNVELALFEEEDERKDLITVGDIDKVYKKEKSTKEERLALNRQSQEGRLKPSEKKRARVNPHASTTNKEKRKSKNFMMIKHKLKGKLKRSFKEKQIALRNYLQKKLNYNK